MKKYRSILIALALVGLSAALPAAAEEEPGLAQVETEVLESETVQAETEVLESETVQAETEVLESETAQTEPDGPAVTGSYDKDELRVGNTTHLNGDFFTDLWGNATSDLDVRKLLFAYSPVIWDSARGGFVVDHTVVNGFVVTKDEKTENQTFRISLYEDMVYSDGTPITAKDYVFSILFSASPQAVQIGAKEGKAEAFSGYEAYHSGQSNAFSGIRLLGTYEFSVQIDSSYLPYFYELGLLDIEPYPIHVIAPGCTVTDSPEGARIENADSSAAEPLFSSALLEKTVLDEQNGYRSHPSVVSGPYVLDSYDGETAVFSANPNYKGNEDGKKPSIPRLVYTLAENDTMIDQLASHELGLVNKVADAQAIQEGIALVKTGSFSSSTYPRSGLTFLSFCTEQEAVKSAAVRQAIAWCLQENAIASGYEQNYGTAVNGFYGMGQWMVRLLSGSLGGAPVKEPAPDASEEEVARYEAETEAWSKLNMNEFTRYSSDNAEDDIAQAVSLLEEDGWTLSESGEPFDPAADPVRCRQSESGLVSLDLTLIYPEGNRIGALLEENLAAPLKKAGIRLDLQAVPMQNLLRQYYGQEERTCDLIYLGTNFDIVYDPAADFEQAEDGTKIWRHTGLSDETLYEAAYHVSHSEPGDLLGYCTNWIAYQKRFMELLPAIPVYSNVYYDFYEKELHGYYPLESVSWAQGITGSYLGDAAAETEAP